MVGKLNLSQRELLQCSSDHRCPIEAFIIAKTETQKLLQEAQGVSDVNEVRILQSKVASLEEQQNLK